MISARMFKIIRFLNQKKESSYKEIGNALDLKERNVRYDIDCINDALSLKGLSEIEKRSKGQLIVPIDLDLNILLEDSEFIFSADERMQLLRFIIMFDVHSLNIKKLSEKFQVSRRSIQNDLDTLIKEFNQYGLSLVYNRHFHLIEDDHKGYPLRVNELKKYIYLFSNKLSEYNTFELELMKLLYRIYNFDILHIYDWITNKMKMMSWTFSDDSFDWYVANILTTCWYIIKEKQLPSCPKKIDVEDYSLQELEMIINKQLDDNQKKLIMSYSSYTNKYGEVDINLDLIMTEDIIIQLVTMTYDELGVFFLRDMILIKGLLNHVAPMLERIKNNIRVYELSQTVIPQSYEYVFEVLKSIVLSIQPLQEISQEELIYITIHFIASIQRLRANDYKNILLICGLGFGATALLKDTLRNEYQVQVIDSIPAYDLEHYQKWEQIDIVISTSKLILPVKKTLIVVNAIFDNHDHNKLEAVGIRKKNVLTNYIAIEKRLGFLNSPEREKVLEIIKEELGYKDVRIPKKYYNISDLLGENCIRYVKSFSNWKDAIKLSTDILIQHGCIKSEYYEGLMSVIKESGFYAVTDSKFALFHSGNTSSVKISSMSLIVTDEPVWFDNKQVRVIFCLASKDKKEHIPAIVKLMRMVNDAKLIEKLESCNNQNNIIKVINECEKEVLSQYI